MRFQIAVVTDNDHTEVMRKIIPTPSPSEAIKIVEEMIVEMLTETTDIYSSDWETYTPDEPRRLKYAYENIWFYKVSTVERDLPNHCSEWLVSIVSQDVTISL